ncbi:MULTISPECIES: hypothetical protein [unclassified Mesorhizobium]|uniref:hypothetical protein n=1 Tax=unclassified Mesorhizobium TaxID=325217 RepID=UPI0013E3B62A|nr:MULTISPECIES: hypothetical protein [unclassified Mesorhizobium]
MALETAGNGADQRVVFRLQGRRVVDPDRADDTVSPKQTSLVKHLSILNARQHRPIAAGLAIGHLVAGFIAGLLGRHKALRRIVVYVEDAGADQAGAIGAQPLLSVAIIGLRLAIGEDLVGKGADGAEALVHISERRGDRTACCHCRNRQE